MRNFISKHGALFLLVLSLTGCALTPDTADYRDQADNDVTQVADWTGDTAGTPNIALNHLIQSDALSSLVDKALRANPDLQQTLLTLRIRQAELRQTGADRLPAVDAGFSATKKEGSDDVYQGSLTVSWEADLWQKIADRTHAAGKDVEQQRALYQAARDTLAAEVMKTWLTLIAQQHAITIEQTRLDTLQKNKQLIRQRYRNGLGNLEDLDSARSSAARSRATLAAYQETLAQQQRTLKTLLGELPQDTLPIPQDYPAVVTPLADLPEQSLRRRPDLIAAYQAIEASRFRVSAAYKDLLPSINLEAALKDASGSPTRALLTDPVWSLLGQLTAPLFHGGELRAAAEIRELESAQQYQSYRDTLLTAVTEVENALGAEQSLAIRQKYIALALQRQQNSLEQYRASYRAGLVDILDLLSVQQQAYDLKAQLDNLIYERLVNRIELGLALGLGVNS